MLVTLNVHKLKFPWRLNFSNDFLPRKSIFAIASMAQKAKANKPKPKTAHSESFLGEKSFKSSLWNFTSKLGSLL